MNMAGRIMNIGIFGRPNAGKSSLLNFLTGTQTAIVSDVPGTTTDPVSKRMEVPGVGICNFIDTAGLADGSSLASLKDEKTLSKVLSLDAALLIIPYGSSALPSDSEICSLFRQNGIPFIILLSKADVYRNSLSGGHSPFKATEPSYVYTACSVKDPQVKERIFTFLAKSRLNSKEYEERPMFEGLVCAGDNVVLVCPIDSEAPAGRLILPQVMAIRQLLDIGAVVTVLRPEQLGAFIDGYSVSSCVRNSAESKCSQDTCEQSDNVAESNTTIAQKSELSLVVTDSQAFAKVAPLVTADVPLTSFSMLLARAKGPFGDYLAGMRFLESLNSDCSCSGTFRVLMLESCTHHSTCEDIGRVKIPAALTKYIKAHCAGVSDVRFTFVSSDDDIPSETPFNLAVQCGGCVVTKRQLMSRLNILRQKGIPLVNYGMCLALCAGIWKRVGSIFQ